MRYFILDTDWTLFYIVMDWKSGIGSKHSPADSETFNMNYNEEVRAKIRNDCGLVPQEAMSYFNPRSHSITFPGVSIGPPLHPAQHNVRFSLHR